MTLLLKSSTDKLKAIGLLLVDSDKDVEIR